MNRPDVVQLRQFYSSALGRIVRHYLAKAVQAHWSGLQGDLVLGLGYATPVLRPYYELQAKGSLSVLAAMPADQGGVYWPSHQENRTILTDDYRLPFADNVMNRMILLHELEHVEQEQGLLQELWRVLTPGGRMLVLVPNRRRIWSGSPLSPFSYGKPYSIHQLREALCEGLFTHVHTSSTLFFRPTNVRWLQKTARFFHLIGKLFCPMMGGVIIMEVEKQIYASVREKERLRSRAYIHVTAPQPALSCDGK